jgi:histone H3/H4
MAWSESAPKEMLIVGTKVKNYIKSKGVMSSQDVLEALNTTVYAALDKAVERAKANGRKTVQGKDV